jgi:hypothetical protein
MELKLETDYVYTRKLNLDLKQMLHSSHLLHKFIEEQFGEEDFNYERNYQDSKVQPTVGSGEWTLSTKVFEQYNTFLYPLPGFQELFYDIKDTFYASLNHRYPERDKSERYIIQSWINFYRKGEFIDWHHHWPVEANSWHGFYCVDVEPDSHTEYQLPFLPYGNKNVTIPSENNLLVISPSEGDLHKSSEWKDETRPRITIAFDVIPLSHLHKSGKVWHLNHWIPF